MTNTLWFHLYLDSKNIEPLETESRTVFAKSRVVKNVAMSVQGYELSVMRGSGIWGTA